MAKTTQLLHDHNIQFAAKQEKLFEEVEELRAREEEATALCRKYKSVAEREQGRLQLMVTEAKQLLSSLPESPIAKLQRPSSKPLDVVNLISPPY